MSRSRIVAFSILVLLVISLWFWFRSITTKVLSEKAKRPETNAPSSSHASGSPVASNEKPSSNQPPVKTKDKFYGLTLDEFAARAFSAKIEFYGKVVDQFGNPVPKPEVIYNAATSVMDEGGKNSATQGDADGNVRVSGLTGATLYVEVNKIGYYRTDKSLGSFSYGTPSGQYPAPTKDNPFVFVLQKMGEIEPLMAFESRSFRISKDGSSVTLDLKTGKVSTSGQLKVEAWTNDQVQNAQSHYDWKCRISIPRGGLVERTGPFDFEAPTGVYREFDEVGYQSVVENWQPRFNKEYFAKLPDGTYARFKFWFTTGGAHFFEVESYLNPIPGSRNLEYDPAKKIEYVSLEEQARRQKEVQEREEAIKENKERLRKAEADFQESVRKRDEENRKLMEKSKQDQPPKTKPYKDEKSGGMIVPALN